MWPYNSNKFPWTNLHGFNLDWVIETVKSYTEKVDDLLGQIDTLFDTYEKKNNLTNARKLSETGNFTGTWFGYAVTWFTERIAQLFTLVDSNADQIQFLTDQFQDGATGLIIECGFFTDNDINNSYDGGVW